MGESENENSNLTGKLEFRLFGKTIEYISVSYGTFLMVWGIVVSLISQSQSFTSLIPSVFGLSLLLFAVLALKIPSKKMLFMHIVVVIGFLTMLGGADFFRGLLTGTNPFINVWAGSSKLMMFGTGLCFIFTCVQSFRFARMNEKSDQSEHDR